MKVEKKIKILLYFWFLIETYHKNLEIWKQIWNLTNLGNFFHGKIFCIGWSHIFNWKFDKIHSWKNFGTIFFYIIGKVSPKILNEFFLKEVFLVGFNGQGELAPMLILMVSEYLLFKEHMIPNLIYFINVLEP